MWYGFFIRLFLLIICIVGINFFFWSWIYFMLDSIFYPMDSLSLSFDTTIYWFIYSLLQYILPYQLFGKLFLVFVFVLAWCLGYLIADYVLSKLSISQLKGSIFKRFPVLFILLNPFMYERVITQTWIFLAIVLLWYGLYFILTASTNYYRNYLCSWLFFGLALAISPHVSFMIALIYGLALLIFSDKFKLFKSILLGSALVTALNINWLTAALFLDSWSVANSLKTFNDTNIQVFETNSLDSLPPELTTLLLYGFWGERYMQFALPQLQSPFRYVFGAIFVLLAGLWLGLLYKDPLSRRCAIFLITLGLLSWILGTWTASGIWWSLLQYVYDYLPWYNGLREPQKWIGVLMLVYAVWIAYACCWTFLKLSDIIVRKKLLVLDFARASWFWFILMIVFLYGWSPHVLFGFNGQLFLSDYPTSYFEAKGVYQFQKDWQKILILPWHSYMACNWTKWRIIPNVMWKIVDEQNSIVSDNIEISYLYSNSTSQRSRDIEEFLHTHDLNLLKIYWIGYIYLLNTCADFSTYIYLQSLEWITNIYESQEVSLFKLQ